MCEDKNTSAEHLGDNRNLAAYDHSIDMAATAYTEKQLYVISYFQFSHCWFLSSHPMLPHHCLLQRHSPVAKRIQNTSKSREIAQAGKSKCQWQQWTQSLICELQTIINVNIRHLQVYYFEIVMPMTRQSLCKHQFTYPFICPVKGGKPANQHYQRC